MRRHSSRFTLLASAASVVVLATIGGCGSDDPADSITVIASETKADPFDDVGYALEGDDVTTEAPTLTVQVDREVTLTLDNRSGQYSPTRASHDLAVVSMVDDLFTVIATGKILDHVMWDAVTPSIFTDESATLTFVPDATGTFQYLCTIPGHARAGMIGSFVVEA